MTLEQTARHVRLYVKSMALIAEIRVMTQLRKTLLGVFAVGLAIFGLGMINLGLYHALTALWGEIWTPLTIGVGNLVLAGIAFLVAMRMHYGPELRVAEELRDTVAADLEADVQSLKSLRGLSGLIGGGLEGNAAGLLVPVVSTIIGALRKRKD
jgi:hypothetical protein